MVWMTPEQFERFLLYVEGRSRGWLDASNVPRCKVFVGGIEVKNVMAVNRRKGVLRVSLEPFRLDKHRKRVLTKTLYGTIRLELF